MAQLAIRRPRFSMPTATAGLPRWVWPLGIALAALAGLAPPLVSLGVLVAGLVVFILLKKPLWGAYALVLSVPVQDTVKLPGGINVTQAAFVLVLGIWWFWMALRSDRRLHITPIGVTLLLFLTCTLPSLWVTTSLPDSLAEISRWIVTILSYIIIVNSVQSRREVTSLIVVMLTAGMSEALLGLVQAYGGLGPASFNVGGLLTRAYGTIGAPNSFAGYINMSVPLAFALAAYHWGKWATARRAAPYLDRPDFMSWQRLRVPLLVSLVAFLLFWTVVTSLSRGAWIGLAFGVLVMVLSLGQRAKGAITGLLAALIILAGLTGLNAVPPVIADRFTQLTSQLQIFDPRGITPNPDNYALVERMVHWMVAGNMFLSSPIVGVGIGNFNTLFNKFGVQGWPYSRGHAHNYYLNLLAEVGIVGLTGYLIMIITTFAVAYRALRRVRARKDLYGEMIVIGALGVLATFVTHNFFENLHALNMGIQWGAALALFTLVWLRPEQPGKGA
ncbi:MAG TPA: O-antigen ligase family protein [Chloroflexia bacterium]|nr:O-antigen ligase family protein [Chloroflexia bacterium]